MNHRLNASCFLVSACFAVQAAAVFVRPQPACAAWVWSPNTGWVGPSGAVRDTPEEQLAVGVGLFDRKEFDLAKKEFRKLLRAYRDSRQAAEAQYYLARCEEEEENYYEAFKQYRKTIQTYPSTARFDEILERELQIANFFLSGAKRKVFNKVAILPARDKAVEIYQAIVEDGPFTEQGELAQYKLGLAHAALTDYEEAVKAFEQVISRYPESPLVDDARFQIAVASLKGTFNAGYDQSSTDLAIQELNAFLRDQSTSDLMEEAEQRLAQLQEQRAEHEFGVGEFYAARKKYQAARIYYETVVSDYAHTTWAPKALSRLETLEARVK